MIPISELLSQPERNFERVMPASEAEIQTLIAECDIDLPSEYLELLRFSNGGGGALALPPLLFYPDDISFVIDTFKEKPFDDLHEQFFVFGSNGGLEIIAFDLRKGQKPYPIVMIDPIAGEDSAIEIASDMSRFIEAMGLEFEDKDEFSAS